MMIIKHHFQFITIILTFLILLSISNEKIVNASSNADIPDTDYDCFVRLNTKLALGFGRDGEINICDINICVSGYISQMSITPKSNAPVNSTDFSCFSKLSSLQLTNATIGDFLYNPLSHSQIMLILESPLNFSITSPIRPFQSLSIINSNITSINLSYISNNPIFLLNEDTIQSINYINDLTSLVTMNTMEIPCSSILNFTNLEINTSLKLKYLELFDKSTMELFSTWTNVFKSLEISGRDTQQSFPYPRLMNSKVSSLTIQHPLIQESTPIDLSSTMTLLNTIIIYQATFNINNSLPFINYPSIPFNLTLTNGNFSSFKIDSLPSTLQTLTLTNCNIKTELPKSVNYSLVLDNNEITGTIDQSYCSIAQFAIKNNQLTGTIPSCYTCFRNSSLSSTFGGNQGLTNIINNSPCTTIKPKILLPIKNNKFTIYGNDLGWDLPIPISPITEYKKIVYNHMFEATVTTQISNISLSINNQNFTLTANQSINPTIQSIIVKELNFQFNGTGFSYDVNDINVLIGNVNCNVTGSTYYELNCALPTPPTNVNETNVQTLITVLTNNGSRSVNVQVSLKDGQVSMLPCSNPCLDGQYCNNINQTCQCKSGFKENSDFGTCTEICPNNCTFNLGQGQCLVGSGCLCNPGFTGQDCSQSYCPLNCSGSNGVCNIQTKTCTCNQLWIGQGCQTPDWKVTGTSLVSPQGGPLAIGGWFGNVNNSFFGLYVSVDNKQVIIYSTSPSQLVGDVGPGTGSKTVTITNYNITKSYQFQYTPSIIQCLKSCSGQGQCNTTDGTCKCNQGYTGFDCSISIDTSSPPPTTTVNSITASTQLEVQDTVYQINIDRLVELGIDNSIINSIELSNNWNYTLLSSNLHLFNQSFNGGNASHWISLTLEEVQVTRMNQFAGTSYELSKDSIKITVEINQYQFNNTLNSLQLQMSTNVGLDGDSSGGGCSSDVQSFDLQSLNYITITKNTKVMYGRFINTILTQGRPTLTTTTIISQNSSSLIIGLNLPHSQHYLIDPDFSLLLSNRDQSSCQSNSRSWVLPVAVAVPIVCVAIIAIVVAIVIKNNRTSIKLKMRSVSMSGLSKKFKK